MANGKRWFPTHALAGFHPTANGSRTGSTERNGSNELRIANIAAATNKVVAFGTQAIFSSNSRWVAYSIGYSETQQDELRKDKKPVHNKLGLLNLATDEQTVVEDIESFAFSPTGTLLAMRRYAAEKKDPPTPVTPPDEEPPPPGATLIVRQLATSRDTTFGNVVEFAWQDLRLHGHLLAMTINAADDKTGNGVQLFDSETGTLRVLDSAALDYSGLAWRKESSDLAFLRSEEMTNTTAPSPWPWHGAI